MRQPHQILCFPYKKNKDGEYVYAIFCRNGKKEVWQGIAGGVEEGETLEVTITVKQKMIMKKHINYLLLE